MEAVAPAIPWRKRTRRAIRAAIILALVRFWGWLPLPLAASLGRFMGSVAWRLAGKYRRLALDHLAIAFPHLSESEREAIGRGCFRHLGWCAAEIAQERRIDARLESYVTFDPGAEETIREAIAEGKGTIVITGHVGNWELLARRIARIRKPSRVVAAPMNSPPLTAAMDAYRARGGVTTLWRGQSTLGREMLATFRDNAMLGLLIDQDTRVQSVWVPFFGKLAATPRAAGDLAARSGAPLLAAFPRRRPEGGHVISVSRIEVERTGKREEDSLALTAACTRAIEDAIRRSPSEWVWMHERWKTPPPQDNEDSGKARVVSAG